MLPVELMMNKTGAHYNLFTPTNHHFTTERNTKHTTYHFAGKTLSGAFQGAHYWGTLQPSNAKTGKQGKVTVKTNSTTYHIFPCTPNDQQAIWGIYDILRKSANKLPTHQHVLHGVRKAFGSTPVFGHRHNLYYVSHSGMIAGLTESVSTVAHHAQLNVECIREIIDDIAHDYGDFWLNGVNQTNQLPRAHKIQQWPIIDDKRKALTPEQILQIQGMTPYDILNYQNADILFHEYGIGTEKENG